MLTTSAVMALTSLNLLLFSASGLEIVGQAVSRRSFFVVAGSIGISTGASPIAAVADDDNQLTLCNQGLLMAESAVPGAYQSACMVLKERKIPLKSFKNRILTIEQGSVGAGSTGVAVWNSGLLLLRLLDRLTALNHTWVETKSFVELGCGTGLCSIGLSAIGASRVVATDGNPDVVALARANIGKNSEVMEGAASQPEAKQLQWGIMDAIELSEEADLIVGSDLTYNSGTWRVLRDTVDTILKPGGVFLYLTLGHAGFPAAAEMQGFLQVCSNGLNVVTDASTVGLPVRDLNRLLREDCVAPEERGLLDGQPQVLLLQKPVKTSTTARERYLSPLT